MNSYMFVRLVLFAVFCSNFTCAFDVMYESYEQINGTEVAEFVGRVKKINRTTAALCGNFTFKKPLDNSYQIKIELFHSPMGNQQFNYYPMKIPPTGVCDFARDTWQYYEKYYRDYVTNNLRIGECPMEPRTMHINNHLLDSKM